jgi:hypothetical protein
MFYEICRVCPVFEKSAEDEGSAAGANKTTKKRSIYPFLLEH